MKTRSFTPHLLNCVVALFMGSQWLSQAAVPLEDLTLWLKADAGITATEAAVSAWADQSGQGHDALQTGAPNQPRLVTSATGAPGVHFDGIDDFLSFNVPIDGLSGLSIVLVADNLSAAQNGGVACSNSPAIFWNETASWGWTYLGIFQTNICWRFGTGETYAPRYARPASLGARHSITTLIKADDMETLYVDGSMALQLDSKQYPLAGASESGYLGRSTTSYFNGDILEILVYTNALDDTGREAAEAYLRDKYFSSQPPTVTITSPAPDAPFAAPANITIGADASDDGSVTQVEFFVNDQSLGVDSTPPYSVEWNNVAAGVHALSAKATDDSGAWTISERVMALVNYGTPGEGPVLNGLGLWYKSDAGLTLEDGAVAQWADQSGRGRHATQTAAWRRPSVVTTPLGTQAVQFDGAGDFLAFNAPINGLDGMTIFLVANSTSAAQNGGSSYSDTPAIFWTETASWGWVFLSPFQTNVNWRLGTTVAQNNHRYPRPESVGDNYTITTLVKNADIETLYVDRAPVLQVDYKGYPLAGVGDDAYLGRGNSTSVGFHGSILEVLVYAGALSDTDREATELYLHQKHLSNQRPMVAITSPSSGVLLDPPASLSVTADASDDGGISQVEFYADGILMATDLTAPYSFQWDNVPSGSFGLVAKAIDATGAWALSERVVVRVNYGTSQEGPVLDGLGLWYKADAGITAEGNAVSRWADQSGYERHAVQSTAASQPAFVASGLGKPAVSFDGHDDYMTFGMPMDGLSGLTLVVVANNTAPQTTGSGGEGSATLFWSESASWGALSIGVFQDSVNWRIGTTVAQTGSPNYPGPAYPRPASINRDYTRTVVVKNEGDEMLYVNGELVTTVSGKEPVTAGIDQTGGNLGRGVLYPIWCHFRGEILEALVYTRNLTESEVAGIDAYLRAKYGSQTPPSVAITAPVNNSPIAARSSLLITADAADNAGSIASVEFFDSGQSVGTVTSAPYTCTIPSVAAGAHTLTAKVTDHDGLFAYSAPVLVFATPASGFAPIDNFENRALGPILYQGDWVGVFGNADDAVVMDPTSFGGGNPGNKVLRLATAKQSLAFPALLPEGATGTLFFRCASTTWSRDDVSLGLSDQRSFGYASQSDYEVQVVRRTGSNLGKKTIGLYDGATLFDQIQPFLSDVWYKIWLVVNNADDTWQMFVQDKDMAQPSQVAHDSVATFSFRNGPAANDLIRFFLWLPQQTVANVSSGGGFWLDDIYLAVGQDLSDPTVVVAMPTLTIRRSDQALIASWPAAASDCRLESSDTLVNPAWTEFGVEPVQAGDEMTVTFVPEGAAMFFRLSK